MSLLDRVSPRRVVPLLTVLVLIGSALSLGLALTRPDPEPPADLPGAGSGTYEAAPLVGTAGPAIEAMVAALPIVLGYDYRDLDGGLAAATALMTESFASAFTRSFNSSARPMARKEKSVAEARVRGAGVVRTVRKRTVVALAYVDRVLVQSTTLKPGDAPEVLTRNRVLVRLVRVDDDWKIANISPV
ncbi:hypothetical protein BH09ACT12_BH09ACT12_25420 [soil metagenome]